MCRHFCRTPTHCAQVADMTTSDPYVTLQLGAENHRTCTIAKVLCVYPSLIKLNLHPLVPFSIVVPTLSRT